MRAVAPRTKVAIVASSGLLRSLLETRLNSESGIHITDCTKSLETLAAAGGLAPGANDVVVIDMEAISENESLLFPSDQESSAPARVLLAHDRSEALILRASACSVCGWAILNVAMLDTGHLLPAIESARCGLHVIDSGFQSTPLHKLRDALSDSEFRILALVAAGLTNASISRDLYISEKTVERSITAIYEKLNLIGMSKVSNPRVLATLLYHDIDPGRNTI